MIPFHLVLQALERAREAEIEHVELAAAAVASTLTLEREGYAVVHAPEGAGVECAGTGTGVRVESPGEAVERLEAFRAETGNGAQERGAWEPGRARRGGFQPCPWCAGPLQRSVKVVLTDDMLEPVLATSALLRRLDRILEHERTVAELEERARREGGLGSGLSELLSTLRAGPGLAQGLREALEHTQAGGHPRARAAAEKALTEAGGSEQRIRKEITDQWVAGGGIIESAWALALSDRLAPSAPELAAHLRALTRGESSRLGLSGMRRLGRAQRRHAALRDAPVRSVAILLDSSSGEGPLSRESGLMSLVEELNIGESSPVVGALAGGGGGMSVRVRELPGVLAAALLGAGEPLPGEREPSTVGAVAMRRMSACVDLGELRLGAPERAALAQLIHQLVEPDWDRATERLSPQELLTRVRGALGAVVGAGDASRP